MRNFLKQTVAYSLVFGVVALIAPASVAAKDARTLNLYGIDTGIIITDAPVFTELQILAIVLSVIAGAALIANGKAIKRILSK